MISQGQTVTIKSNDEWNGIVGQVVRIYRSGTLSVQTAIQDEPVACEPNEVTAVLDLPANIEQLKQQRSRLATDMQLARQELWHHQDERVERMGMGESYRYDAARMEREVAETEQALAAFDATYPVVKDLLDQERDEMVERNRWN